MHQQVGHNTELEASAPGKWREKHTQREREKEREAAGWGDGSDGGEIAGEKAASEAQGAGDRENPRPIASNSAPYSPLHVLLVLRMLPHRRSPHPTGVP